MLDQTLYPKFSSDANNKQTSIYPIIVIGWNTQNSSPFNDAIYVSTVSESMTITYPTEMDSPELDTTSKIDFIDADLKLSSIKESIDFESRKFKISNLTITFSNYSKLADLLANVNLMNKEVAVFYKSKSCKDLSDCLPIYIANVRRYDYTSKSIKITLEDNTQEKISKDIPIANVGTDPSMTYSEKYHNRYIPITYGRHLYAPAILWPDPESSTSFHVICDDVYNEEREINVSPYVVSIKKGEYWFISPNVNHDLAGGSYPITDQWTELGLSIHFKSHFDGGLPLNIVAANEIQGYHWWWPNSATLIEADGVDIDGNQDIGWIWNGGIDDDEDHEVPEIIEMSAPENATFDYFDKNLFGVSGKHTYARIPNNDKDTMGEIEGQPECDFSNGYDFSGTQFGEDYNPFKFVPKIWSDANLPRIKWDGNEEYMDYDNQVALEISDVMPGSATGGTSSGAWGWHNYVHTHYNPGSGDSHYVAHHEQSSAEEAKWPRVHHLRYLCLADEVSNPDNNFDTPEEINGGVAFIQLPSARQIMLRIKELADSGALELNSFGTQDDGTSGLAWNGDESYGYPEGHCLMSASVMDWHNWDHGYGTGDFEGSSSPFIHSLGLVGNWHTYNITHGGPHEFPDPYDGYSGDEGYNHWLCPSIQGADPEGNIFWLFGCSDYTAADTSAGQANATFPSGGWGTSNAYDLDGNEYTGKFIKVSFDKNVGSLEATTTQNNRIVEEISIFELFDLSQSPIVIPYEINSDGHNWEDDVNQGRSIRPAYNCYWNGVYPNNYDGGTIEEQRGIMEGASGGASYYARTSGGSTPGTQDYYAAESGTPRLQQLISSGADRWFSVPLSSWKGLPAGTLLSNHARAWQEHTGSYSGDVGVDVAFTGGSVQSTTSEDYMVIRSEQEGNGRLCGIRFNLPELEIEDNIDGAFYPIHRRKIGIGIDPNNSDDVNDNSLEMYVYANNSDRYEDDYEKSRTDINNNYTTWQYSYLISRLSGNSLDPTVVPELNNWFTQDTLEGQSEGSGYISDDDLGNNFTEDDIFYSWLYPDQYNSFNLIFKGKSTEDVTARNLSMNIKLYYSLIEAHCDFNNLNESDFYVTTEGRVNEVGTRIQNPAIIIKDILIRELNYNDTIDDVSFNKAQLLHTGWEYAFSIKDKTNSKKFIEDFSRSTKFFPNFKRQKSFGFTSISDSYNENSDYNMVIDINDISSYNYSKTKMEQVKSKVEVKYSWDYGNDKFKKNTGWVSAKDFLGDGDEGYVNPDGSLGYSLNYFNTTEEDTSWSFESKYIQDSLFSVRDTANKLSEFLVMWYCNQHTILNLKMIGFKYSFLEVGDIIKFEELIEGKTIYGEDYTTSLYRNGQLIYPLFLITSIVKTANGIEIEGLQLHKLTKEFPANNHPTFINDGLGDINRDGVIEEAGRDLDLLIAYVHETTPRSEFTRYQIKAMDINDSKSINQRDIDIWPEWYDLNSQGWES